MILLLIPLLPLLVLLVSWLWPAEPDQPAPWRSLAPRPVRAGAHRRPGWVMPDQERPDPALGVGLTRLPDALAAWYQERWEQDPDFFDRIAEGALDWNFEAEPLTLAERSELDRLREAEHRKPDPELRAELRREFYRLAEDQSMRDQGIGVLAALVGVPIRTARGWWARGVKQGTLRPYERTALQKDNDEYRWTPQEAGRRFR